jgi:hypothetical protein
LPRRAWIAGVLALAVSGLPLAHAQESGVPPTVQADLISKVALYDRNFAPRAGNRAVILLASRRGVPDSLRAATQLSAALQEQKTIGGLPHDELLYEYSDPAALVATCREKHCAIIFFGPGFSQEVERLRMALDGVNVLTISSVPNDVRNGIVLGIDLIGGKPKLLLNMPQARRQQVDFHSDVLRMMVLFQ